MAVLIAEPERGSGMVKKKKPVTPPADDRVTVVNLKGLASERDALQRFTRKTGISASQAVRRGLAMFMSLHGFEPPADWKPD